MYSRLNGHEILGCVYLLSSSRWMKRNNIFHMNLPTQSPPDSLDIAVHNVRGDGKSRAGKLQHGKVSLSIWEYFHMEIDRSEQQQKNVVQFPSDWARRVEMMKKFNLMFNSNSHPFFISFFPVTVPKMVIRFSIYMITNKWVWFLWGGLRIPRVARRWDESHSMGFFLIFFPFSLFATEKENL